MDERLSMAPVVAIFAEAVRPVAGVLGFYAGGSLASGDFRPGVSDLDLVAVLAHPLPEERHPELIALHEQIPAETKLHCAYVPAADAADVTREHLAWAHDELFRRPLSGIARAEVLRGGITVYGPPPSDLLPPVTDADLAEAARVELAGYWSYAITEPDLWLQDLHVDLGLTTLARADATIEDGRLITKREAIARLPRLGVPAELAAEIAHRRAGEQIPLTDTARRTRATLTRHLMTEGIARLGPPA